MLKTTIRALNLAATGIGCPKIILCKIIYDSVGYYARQNMSGRIRIHFGPWIRIQRYKMMGKAEFNQQKSFITDFADQS